jgi:S-DNA-T family DNA segregation ATPase FtsK/SpoIIIE
VSDKEVHAVVHHLKTLGEPNYIEGILTNEAESGGDIGEYSDGGGEKDELYDEAVAIVLKSRRASISSVQRQLRIGYNRAARLIEDMERAGLVSEMQSNGSREVIVKTGE